MTTSGMVLRIEKTSIHDGEGLRTVVFLKGCPLRCKWCSTPESQHGFPEHGYGTLMSVDEIMHEICKDEVFFFHSGGGVTISGGEVLAQADFAEAILHACMEEGISAAIETSLYADYSQIKKLIPYLDTMYIDFKIADESAHSKYTGVSNRKIRENLLRLNQDFPHDIHIRIPSIPEINLTEENMEETALFLRKLHHLADIELLPYHRLGITSYQKLGRTYELADTHIPSMDEMRKMANVIHHILPDHIIKIKGRRVRK